MYKNIKRSLLTLAIVFVCSIFFGSSHVSAATRTASVSGSWSDTATWGGSAVPTISDDVIINSGITVTSDMTAEANSIVINSASSNTILNLNGNPLTVTGNFLINSPSVDSTTSTVYVSDSVVSIGGNLTITGGSSGTARNSVVQITSGHLTVNGNVIFSGTASMAQLLFTFAGGQLTVLGNFGSGGTLTTSGNGTILFGGTGAQTMGAYNTYNNVTVNSGSVTTIQTGSVIINNNLIVNGTIDMGATSSLVSGTTTVANGGTLTISDGSGSHNFTGLVTVSSGGTWNETTTADAGFWDGITNSGTFTASAGIHTLMGSTLTGTLSIPSVTVSDDSTNNGSLTVSTALSGAYTLTNSATGTLVIGGTSTITGLTATAVGNVVTYNKSGAQAVKAVSYDTLNLSGSGVKTIGSGITIAGSLSIDSGVSAALTGNSTADELTIDGTLRASGSWGSTSSVATNKNDTYFSGTGIVTVATGSSTPTSNSGGSNYGHPANQTPSGMGGSLISFITKSYSSAKNTVVAKWNNVVNATGMSFAVDPQFIGGVITTFVNESTVTLPSVANITNLYGRVYSATGDFVQYGPVLLQSDNIPTTKDEPKNTFPEKTYINTKDFSDISPTPNAGCPATYPAYTSKDLYDVLPTKNIQWLLNQEVNAHIHIDGHGGFTTKAGIIAYKKKYQIEIGLTNTQVNSAYIDPITLGHMNAKLCAW